MYKLEIQLLNYCGCIIDRVLANDDESPSEAIKRLVSTQWKLDIGDTIRVREVWVE